MLSKMGVSGRQELNQVNQLMVVSVVSRRRVVMMVVKVLWVTSLRIVVCGFDACLLSVEHPVRCQVLIEQLDVCICGTAQGILAAMRCRIPGHDRLAVRCHHQYNGT